MPTVEKIGAKEHGFQDLCNFLDCDEYEWVTNNIGDLHSYNWGIKQGKAIIFDYACR